MHVSFAGGDVLMSDRLFSSERTIAYNGNTNVATCQRAALPHK